MSHSLANETKADTKQIPTASRFDFDRPLSDTWPDWPFQDRSGSAALGSEVTGTQSTDEHYNQDHEPAPVQERAKTVKHAREPWQPKGSRPRVVIVALGLVSFGIAFGLEREGGLGHFIQSNLMSPSGTEADKEISTPETPNVTDLTVSSEQPLEVEAVAQPEVQLPNPTPAIEKLADTAEQDVPSTTAEQDTPSTSVVAPQQQGDVIRDCADCPELIAVSAGNFTKVDEAGSTTTIIDHDFAIGRYDITFDDWDRCVDDGACKAIADDGGWGRGSRPLIFVSFDDVTNQYLPWLSRLSGKEYRLPTKDEWHYAALGGAGAAETKSRTSDASQDCFNAAGPAAENCPDTYIGTAPVGSFAPNALGLYGMKGNVWEWSADCWRPFSYSPNTSSNNCDKRVVLGGAWSTGRSEVNGHVAAWEKSSRRTNSIGFRAVRSLP